MIINNLRYRNNIQIRMSATSTTSTNAMNSSQAAAAKLRLSYSEFKTMIFRDLKDSLGFDEAEPLVQGIAWENIEGKWKPLRSVTIIDYVSEKEIITKVIKANFAVSYWDYIYKQYELPDDKEEVEDVSQKKIIIDEKEFLANSICMTIKLDGIGTCLLTKEANSHQSHLKSCAYQQNKDGTWNMYFADSNYEAIVT